VEKRGEASLDLFGRRLLPWTPVSNKKRGAMKKVAKSAVAIALGVFLFIDTHPVVAKQDKTVRMLVDRRMSVMECLCVHLTHALYDTYQNNNPLIVDAVYSMAEHTRNREIIRSLDAWKKALLRQFEARAMFDSETDRLIISVASHGAPGSLDAFKHYWEEVRSTILLSAEITRLPRYKILHLLVIRKIREFRFHGGGASPRVEEEESIKNQLIDRLKINIFFSTMIKEYLFREYCDGLWKRIGLSFL
jgi:hypothetical protein